MERRIVHMDLDTFFVSVERLMNSELNGKPIIIGGTSDRGVVASCSYESRLYGVSSAMPMRMAKQLCPNAIVIRGDMDAYSRYSDLVTEVIADESPIYEKASIDEHYLDITGMDRFFGCLQWTKELRSRIIKETGLPISFGLSINKTVSKIATGESKPNGEMHIQDTNVKLFLTPLSIKKIPGVGDKTYRSLRTMGVDTIGTLSAVPHDVMLRVMGKNGDMLWKKANGIDTTPVKPYSKRKSIGTEKTFEKDEIDMLFFHQLLVGMVEKLGYELRKSQWLSSCITVKIRYSNFDTHTQQKRIPYTSLDHHLMDIAKELFVQVYNRRMRLRLIGVRLSHLIQGTQQLNMFDDTPHLISLYQAWDAMRNRYGGHAIKRAVTMKNKT